MIGKVKGYYSGIYADKNDSIISFRIPPEGAYTARLLIDGCKRHERSKEGAALSINIKEWKPSRSLDQNAFMWGLLDEMAGILKTSKDELYCHALEKYGVWHYLKALSDTIPELEKVYRVVQVRSEEEVSGKTIASLFCYPGSSHYDTAQMAKLLDGIISEAKDMGIDPEIVKMGLEG